MLFNRIYTYLGIKSLKGRLRLSFVSLLVLLVILGTIPLYIAGKKERLDLAFNEIDKVINLQQTVVNNWLDEKIVDLVTLAKLPSFKEMDFERMKQALETYGENYDEFSAIIYANKDGITEITSAGNQQMDVSNREYFIESKKGNIFISDILIGKISKNPIITISTPVYSSDNEYSGVVVGTIPLENMDFIMKEFRDESGETYLVDKNGMLITESRQGNIGEHIDSKAFTYALENKPINDFYKVNNGDKVLGNYRWVSDNSWIIIGEIKQAEIHSSMIKIGTIFIVELIFLTIFGWFLISRLTSLIRNPINRVLDGTKNIGEGRWGFRLVNEGKFYEAREFQELSSNFNNMAELIEDNILSLAKSEERFRMIAEYSSDIITIHDLDGNYLYISPSGKEILGYDDIEMIGRTNDHFVYEGDINKVIKKRKVFQDTGYGVFTYRMRHKDGSLIWLESSAKRLVGSSIDETRIFVISRNITERKEAEKKLKEANKLLRDLSLKDGLLGIWNRRAFDEHLEVEWDRALREGQTLSALMIDIDYFKNYNDSYGHQLGDDCLKQVANTLKESLKRAGDLVFRYGGEEFSVILANTNEVGAKKVAENIKKAIHNLALPHDSSQVAEIVTVSIGVNTIIPNQDLQAKDLIEGADKALYRAKETGRDRISVYEG